MTLRDLRSRADWRAAREELPPTPSPPRVRTVAVVTAPGGETESGEREMARRSRRRRPTPRAVNPPTTSVGPSSPNAGIVPALHRRHHHRSLLAFFPNLPPRSVPQNNRRAGGGPGRAENDRLGIHGGASEFGVDARPRTSRPP
ncbi:unnamed protein product [Lampetra fluviatilis]